MVMHTDMQRVADAVHSALGPQLAAGVEDLDDFRYAHLSQCLLATVYSLQASAASERAVVRRYTDFAGLTYYRPGRRIMIDEQVQEPLDDFCRRVERVGAKRFAEAVLENRRPVHGSSSILRIEAVQLLAILLLKHDVRYMQDIFRLQVIDDPGFERLVLAIPGIGVAALYYFYMLVGSEDYAKPDVHVLRFLERALGRPVRQDEVLTLLRGATRQLQPRYSFLTPRLLDAYIWRSESGDGHSAQCG